MMIGRAIEIYLTAMFAPIPFALMGFDETAAGDGDTSDSSSRFVSPAS